MAPQLRSTIALESSADDAWRLHQSDDADTNVFYAIAFKCTDELSLLNSTDLLYESTGRTQK